MSKRSPVGRYLDPSWPLRPVRSIPYAERLEITVLESGSRTTLFVGKTNGECVGVLEGDGLDELVEQIMTRRRRRDSSNALGVAMATEGRQKHKAKRKGPA